MYDVLKKGYPSHGIEIVFISSDRDEDSFNRYCSTMPWLAIPYHQLATYKQRLSNKYTISGIPSLVILDSISGQVVVSSTDSRTLVMQTCQAGTDQAICQMFTSHWLNRIPSESQQLLDLLAMSDTDAIKPVESNENIYLQSQSDEFCTHLINNDYMEKQKRIKVLVEQLVDDDDMDENEAYEAAVQVEDVSRNEQDDNIQDGVLDGLFERVVITNTTMEGYQVPSHSKLAERILHNADREQLSSVLTTIWKYFNNCFKEPWNPKFRHFQLSFKVADNITKIDGGLELLLSIGFQIHYSVDDYTATIPIPVDLNEMKKSIYTICTQFNVPLS
jgi:Thioredoxin-like/PUB domain